MQIDRLELENFGPFYGKHSIDLDVTRSAPVVLVHGENMRGKTSLQNAIRWCLYGEAVGRLGLKKPTYRLISFDALDAGEWFMNAALEFSHDGHRYRLERHVQASHRPVADGDLEERATLKRDGHLLPERDIVVEIGNILHPDILRFFLFDGEMLAQYEMLVSDPSRSTEIIKQSIERILGLPALKLAVQDLRELLSSAQARQTKSIKREADSAQLAADSEWLEGEVTAIDGDLQNLRALLEKYRQDREALAERRERFAEIQVDVRQSEELAQHIAETEKERTDLIAEIREHLSGAWWAPVSDRAAALRDELQAALVEGTQTQLLLAQHQQTQGHLEVLVSQEACPVCKQRVGAEETSLARTELENVKVRIASFDVPDLREEQRRLAGVQQFIGREHLAGIREKERQVRQMGVRIYSSEGQLRDVNERLRGHDRAEIRRVQEDYDTAVGEIHDIERSLADAERRREEKQSALTSIRQKIAKLPLADKRIVKETELYDALVVAFETAILGLREELRTQVQDEATSIFRDLTTEQGYHALQINEQYGLQIIDDRGRPIVERSAGAEQIVALALIGALNRCTVREGPVIMDTPFGRLDEGHRGNILTFIPSMSSQVVLLVQSGEFNVDRDLIHLEGKIGRRYRLVRDESATRSRIEVVNEAQP